MQNLYTESDTFLYTNNKLSGKEMKKTISFTITSKSIKYLGLNVTKRLKDLFLEDYKKLREEIKDTSKWKDTLCS